MKFKDGKTFSAYVRSKLHSGYITVPKKLGPGEPHKRRMCMDYCHINALQTEVDSSSRECMSLYPLPKNR